MTMSKQVQRFDKTSLDRVEKTREGFMVAPMRATRTGVFVYNGPDGKPFRELRPPEEVFKQASMQSLAMKPITNGHPYELVNSENSARYLVGYTGEQIKVDEDRYILAMAALTDDSVIQDIESGKVEVSCGYTNDLEMTAGWWDPEKKQINQEGRGEQFDAIQRNIRYNHVAVVTRGRAGSEVRLRLDGDFNLIQEEKSMKVTIDGIEYEMDAAAAGIVSTLKKQVSETAEEIAKLDKDNADLTKKAETLQARVDELDAQLKEATDPVKVNARVKERTHVVATANAVMRSDDEDKTAELETLDDLEIMKRTIKAVHKDEDLEGKNEHYIRGRFDALAEKVNADTADAAGATLGAGLESGRQTRKDAGQEGDQMKQVRMRADELKIKFSPEEISKGMHVDLAKKELGLA